MKMFLYLLQLGSLLLILSGNALADDRKSENQAYFSVLTDIPVMPEMEEMADQAFVFDKAEGRVVGAVGFLSPSSSLDPIKFYETALLQLGWKPLKTGVFQRNGEQLVVKAEKLTHGILVKFQLSPMSR